MTWLTYSAQCRRDRLITPSRVTKQDVLIILRILPLESRRCHRAGYPPSRTSIQQRASIPFPLIHIQARHFVPVTIRALHLDITATVIPLARARAPLFHRLIQRMVNSAALALWKLLILIWSWVVLFIACPPPLFLEPHPCVGSVK